jgi:hypothetical protein
LDIEVVEMEERDVEEQAVDEDGERIGDTMNSVTPVGT